LYRRRLYEVNETVSNLGRRQSALQAALNKTNSDSDTAVKIAYKLVDVTKRLNTEQERQNTLLQAAARAQREFNSQASVATNLARSRAGRAGSGFAAFSQAADQVRSGIEQAAIDKSIARARVKRGISGEDDPGLSYKEIAAAAYEAERAVRDLEKTESEAARKRLAAAVAAKNAAPAEVIRRPVAFGYASPAGPAGSPTAVEGSVQNMVNRMRERAAAETAAGKAAAQTTFQYRLQVALAGRVAGAAKQLEMELLAGAAAMEKELQLQQRIEQVLVRIRRARRQDRVQDLKAQKAQGGKALEGAAIGGAFPLLFGGGAGSIIGGALGGGLNTANPIFSVFTSAIGQLLDQFAAAAQDTGKALRDPITNFQKLAEAGLLASKSQEYYISRLIEVGHITEATAIIQGEMVKKIGAAGVNDLTRLGDSSDRAAKAWAELNLQMQAAIAGPLADLLDWITRIIGETNKRNRTQAAQTDFLTALNTASPKAYQQYFKDSIALRNANGGVVDEAKLQQLQQRYIQQYGLTPGKPNATTTSPQALQDAADKQLAAAERAEALRRQGIQLERQAQDLRLQIEDQAYGFRKRAADLERATLDLRRSIEDEIYKKRQDIARIEIDNARQQAQLAIERLDLQLSGSRVSGNVPGQDLANSLLDAVRQYVKTRSEAEANLQQKERLHTIEMEDLKKASEKFRFDVARKVDELNRQGAELTRDVERAKITTARAIYDLQVQAADYQVAKMKEAISLMTNAAQQLAATSGLTGQIAGPYGALSGLIGGVESYGGNYGAFNRGGSNNGHTAHGSGVDPNLVNMTIAEIQRRQLAPNVPRNQQLHAVGKYQIIGGTLRGLLNGSYGNTGVTANDKFTPEVQEKLFAALARNRLVPGSVNQSMAGLRQEWIGLQNVPDAQLAPIVKQLLAGGSAVPAAPATAPAPTAPALPASVGQATSQLGGIKLPGASDVSGLLASMGQLDQKLLSAKTNALELAKAFTQLTKEQAAQVLSQSVTAITDQLNAPLDQIIKSQQDAAAFQREYAGLIKDGMTPALAEQVAKIREQVRLQLEQLDTAVAQLEATKTKLMAEGKWTEELQKQLDLLKAQRGVIEGKGTAAEKGAIDGDKGKKIRDYITQLQGELNDTEGMILSLAQTIEGEIGSAMSNAITGLITGTTTVQQAMSQMFANIGKAFIDMATQMIAKALVMKVLGIFGNSLGGGGFGGFSGAGPFSQAGGWNFEGPGMAGFGANIGFASGGFVTGPTRAIIGEGGESEYVIPASKMGAAMNRYAAGRRGSSVIPDSSSAGGGGGAGGGGHFTLETVVINNVEYATVEQVRAMGRQSAQQGAASGHSRVMGDLRNKRSVRSRMGLA
jgi:hypothetical protein